MPPRASGSVQAGGAWREGAACLATVCSRRRRLEARSNSRGSRRVGPPAQPCLIAAAWARHRRGLPVLTRRLGRPTGGDARDNNVASASARLFQSWASSSTTMRTWSVSGYKIRRGSSRPASSTSRVSARSSTSRMSNRPASLFWLSSFASMATQALKGSRCNPTLNRLRDVPPLLGSVRKLLIMRIFILAPYFFYPLPFRLSRWVN